MAHMGWRRLNLLRRHVRSRIKPLAAPHPAYVLTLSICDTTRRAVVTTVTGASFETAWQALLAAAAQQMKKSRLAGEWFRIDWPSMVTGTTVEELRTVLSQTKRNYFRLGLSFDPQFAVSFLEQELNANAMFYGGNGIEHCVINERNFDAYAKSRVGADYVADWSDQTPLWAFMTDSAFLDEAGLVYPLYGHGAAIGWRQVESLDRNGLDCLIESGYRYLASQVKPDGVFVYGYHPCFDREIQTYNRLRHASSTYAMIEAYEIAGDERLLGKIDLALGRLVGDFIQFVDLPDGQAAAFLVDVGSEIKLGGNAAALLALTKHASVTGDRQFIALMEKLAVGIVHMQDPDSGSFRHVLRYPDLSTKEDFRTIYYEGEAAFALMRLYGLTGDERWLASVEKAFGAFFEKNHAQHHDHWLAYCANELSLYRPEERYFQFILDNIAGYLTFVEDRVTTFPTLLELMMATRQAISRIDASPAFGHLLDELDLAHFERALEKRAHHLLNGYFFPEIAMFMRTPQRIEGAFFIRHQGFRVRIDDVEHYLSGLIAYRRYLDEREAFRRLVRRRNDPLKIRAAMRAA